jgi:hypothetical protein
MAEPRGTRTDTTQGATMGGGGATGPNPDLHERVVSGDRNTGRMRDKPARHSDEQPRDKPTEEEADRDVKEGAETALEDAKRG